MAHAHVAHARAAHRAAGQAPLSAAWSKAYHPRHATRGVLAVPGEPLRAPAVRPHRAVAPPVTVRPAQCPVPSAPGSVSATGGANQAAVTWTAANGNGSTITAYLVREATGADVGASIATGGSATTATLTGLAGGTAATISVAAQSTCGTGPAGTSAAVTPSGATTTYLGSVQASTPTAFYRLAEPSGATIIADSSGNGADGAYSGQETLGQPAALASDPASSAGYTSCCSGIGSANPALPLYNTSRTVEAWVNTSSGTTNQAIVGYGPTSTDEAFIVSVSASSINVDGWNDYLAFPTPRPVDDGHWHMLAASYDGTTVTVYLDGQQVGSAQFAGTVNTLGPSGLSMASFPGYNVLNGEEADVAVYPAALTAATLTAHFSASGYSRPVAVKNASVFSGGPNGADVSWGIPAGGGGADSYLVSALGGQGSPSVSVPGDATAARITGLAPGSYTFKITGMNPYGNGPAVTTKAFTVTGAASTYASTVLSSKPSAFYRLADTAPHALADSSGNAATGAYTAQATLNQTGPLGSDPAPAISSTGNGPAAGANPSLPLFSQARTMEGWINTTSNNTQFLAGYGVQSTGQGFTLVVQPDDVIVSGYGDDLTFTTPAAINDGHWHFIAAATDGTSATAYLDGKSLGTRQLPSMLDTVPAPQGLQIGAGVQGCCGFFSGALADVAVFPSALTGAELTAQFAASGLATPPAPGAPAASAGANQATVTWTAPTGADPAVTGYLVTAVNGSAAQNAVSVPATATTATVTGLAGGTAYTFKIKALNEYGAGAAAVTGAVTPTGPATTYASTVLSSSPSVFYRLADTDSGAMADSSGNGALGAYTGQVTLGQGGPLGNDAATAIGSNGNGPAASGRPSLPLFAAPRTVEGWINTTSGNTQFLAAYGTQSTGEGFTVIVQPHDVIVSGYSDDLTFITPAAIDDGAWHFIVAASNGTSATAYLDGKSLGTQTFPSVLNTLASPQGFLAGSGVQGCCGFVSGGLADVAVFPSALTAAKVSAQFAASGIGRPQAPGSPSATAGANQATVSWTAPPGANPAVSGYLVTAVKGTAAQNSVSVPATATSTTVTGLAGGTAYTFKIQALNEYGAGTAAVTGAVTPTGTATTYASTVLSAKPSVFYRLADTDRGALADSSGNGALGAYTGQATLGQGGPLASDPATATGSNGNGPVAGGNPALPVYAQPRTLEGWINTTSGNTQFLAGYGNQSTAQGFDVVVQPGDVIVSGYGDDLTFGSTAPLNDGAWHFIAATTDGTSATVYLDGTSLGTQIFPTPLDTLATPSGLQLGSGPQGCCGFFSGALADIAVFPSALTGAQVTAQFAASGLGRPPAPTSPTATAGANQATVSWTAPAGSDPAVTGYLITAVSGGTPANAVSVPATASSTTLTGLAGGTGYTFKIQALNEYGAGTAATTAAVTPTGPATTYASTVLSDSPSAFYRLADTDRGAMADSSGNGALGAYTGLATLGQTGPLGNDAATAAAANCCGPVASAHPALPLYSQPRTVEGWINTTGSGNEFLLGYGGTGTTQGFGVFTQPHQVIVSGLNDDLSFLSAATLNDGAWHFIAATTNGTTATAYVDGVSLGTKTFHSTLDTLPTASGLELGAGPQACCGSFGGDLADIAVFPSVLTGAQVSAQFAASGLGRPPAPGSPVATPGANKATVSWSAPSGADPAVTGYLVTAMNGSTPANAVSVPATASSTSVTGLAGGTAYTFRIQALNEYGAGPAATTSAVTPTGTATTYASTVLAANPSAFYRLADTDRGAMADSSGNGALGTYAGQATLGQPGPLVTDTATGISSTCCGPAGGGNPALPLYAHARTLEGWINTTSGGEGFLAGYGNQGTGQGFTVATEPSAVIVSGYGDDLSFTSTAALNNGAWHFIVVTTNGTSATVYVDGTSLGSQNFPATLDTLPTASGLQIGAGPQGCCGSFSGGLADIAVFPSALTAAQVSAEYTASGNAARPRSRAAEKPASPAKPARS
ncbi:MAG TPA: LamG-like jellyroll fold domain-containing protein [Streptosporangiaceae bacterium]|nr:LamG-like jellyroll fold domain-containing protein [Streptosporangiaceae bacterium]